MYLNLNCISQVEQEEDWALRVGGAEVQLGEGVIPAVDGVLVIIESLFVDYSRLNTSVIESAELAVDVGPFTNVQVCNHSRDLTRKSAGLSGWTLGSSLTIVSTELRVIRSEEGNC